MPSATAPSAVAWSEVQLRGLLRCEPASTLRRGPGRVAFLAPAPGGGEVVVKRARGRPGWDGWRELLTGAPARSQGQREWSNLHALAASGVPVPRALAWAREGETSLVVLELVRHRESLRQRLTRDPGSAARFGPELAAVVARLHDAGWCHRDLYLEHVVVAEPTERLVLLDLGRARHRTRLGRRWVVKDLAALAHSSRNLPEEARCAFLTDYLAARGLTADVPGARAPLARAVLARAERMARHTPRHIDLQSQEGGLAP
jgi:tRNA A-37 threonylcarbamoyl transferase component Bud32